MLQITVQHVQMRSRFTNSACRVLPKDAGLRSTMTPAASNAEIFESAPPLPPLTIAPICTVSMRAWDYGKVVD